MLPGAAGAALAATPAAAPTCGGGPGLPACLPCLLAVPVRLACACCIPVFLIAGWLLGNWLASWLSCQQHTPAGATTQPCHNHPQHQHQHQAPTPPQVLAVHPRWITKHHTPSRPPSCPRHPGTTRRPTRTSCSRCPHCPRLTTSPRRAPASRSARWPWPSLGPLGPGRAVQHCGGCVGPVRGPHCRVQGGWGLPRLLLCQWLRVCRDRQLLLAVHTRAGASATPQQ